MQILREYAQRVSKKSIVRDLRGDVILSVPVKDLRFTAIGPDPSRVRSG